MDAAAEVPGQADDMEAIPKTSAATDTATQEVIAEQGEHRMHGNSLTDAVVADTSEPDQV